MILSETPRGKQKTVRTSPVLGEHFDDSRIGLDPEKLAFLMDSVTDGDLRDQLADMIRYTQASLVEMHLLESKLKEADEAVIKGKEKLGYQYTAQVLSAVQENVS